MRGAALAALLHLGALVRCASESKWVYAHEPGDYGVHAAQEETWGGTCASGRHQSPIDVQTGLVADGGASLDGGIEPRLETVPMMLINNGHAFQLHKTEPGYDPDPDGTDTALGKTSKGHTFLRGQRYNFYQVHWHAPSENTIDGKLYAMEAHFVHQLDDSEWGGDGSLVGTLDHLAVLGVMYELSDECNEQLEAYWDHFPHDASAGVEVLNKDETIDLQDVVAPLLSGGYYHWSGSLTTPPCTEDVDWNLFKRTLPVCQRQVDRLRDALGISQSGVRANNRVPQPLNQRTVVGTSAGGADIDLDVIDYSAISVALIAIAFAVALGVLACQHSRRIKVLRTQSQTRRPYVMQGEDADGTPDPKRKNGFPAEMQMQSVDADSPAVV